MPDPRFTANVYGTWAPQTPGAGEEPTVEQMRSTLVALKSELAERKQLRPDVPEGSSPSESNYSQMTASSVGAMLGERGGEYIGVKAAEAAAKIGPRVAAKYTAAKLAPTVLRKGIPGIVSAGARRYGLKAVQTGLNYVPWWPAQFMSRALMAVTMAELATYAVETTSELTDGERWKIAHDRAIERAQEEGGWEMKWQGLFGAIGGALRLPYFMRAPLAGRILEESAERSRTLRELGESAASRLSKADKDIENLIRMPLTPGEAAGGTIPGLIQNVISASFFTGGLRKTLQSRDVGIRKSVRSWVYNNLGKNVEREKVGDLALELLRGELLIDPTNLARSRAGGIVDAQQKLASAFWEHVVAEGSRKIQTPQGLTSGVVVEVKGVKSTLRKLIAGSRKTGDIAEDVTGVGDLRRALGMNPGYNPGLRRQVKAEILKKHPKYTTEELTKAVNERMLDFTDLAGAIDVIRTLNAKADTLQFTLGTTKGPAANSYKTITRAMTEAVNKSLKRQRPDLLDAWEIGKDLTIMKKTVFENQVMVPIIRLGEEGLGKQTDQLIPIVEKMGVKDLDRLKEGIVFDPAREARRVIRARGLKGTSKIIPPNALKEAREAAKSGQRTWSDIGASVVNRLTESNDVLEESTAGINRISGSKLVKSLDDFGAQQTGKPYWERLLGNDAADDLYGIAESIKFQQRTIGGGLGRMMMELTQAGQVFRIIQVASAAATGAGAAYTGSLSGATLPVIILGLPAGLGWMIKSPTVRKRFLEMSTQLGKDRVFDPNTGIIARGVARATFRFISAWENAAAAEPGNMPPISLEFGEGVTVPDELADYVVGPPVPMASSRLPSEISQQ